MSESKKYDCFRGCEVVDCEDGTTEVTYREGCCKLPVHNYLRDISSLEYADVFEVRFKNTRKGYYKNSNHLPLEKGDIVAVEASRVRACVRATRWWSRPHRATIWASFLSKALW